jgi:hypothetical protein
LKLQTFIAKPTLEKFNFEKMFIEVGPHLVSTQLFEKQFVCDLISCKGACCVHGNSGAPLTFEEIDFLEESMDSLRNLMSEEGINAVEKTGVFYMDQENEPVTTLVNGGMCAFAITDERGITKCAVECASVKGKISFEKPISCHLYPIRVKKFHDKKALVFDSWDICAPACSCGEKLAVPVYRFLKPAIIRSFGQDFYDQLQFTADQWANRKE